MPVVSSGIRLRVCRACGADNRPIARLCDQCGAELAGPAPLLQVPEDRYADLGRPGVLAARLLNQTYSVSYRLIEHRLRGTGVSPSQFRALSIVKLMPPPLTPGLLALHMALDARTVSDLIGRLEQCSLMRRVRDLPDRRAARLELTEEGEAMLARVWSPMVQAMEEIWDAIPPEELPPFIRVLITVRDSCLKRLGYTPRDIFALGPELSPD
ncbi:MAG: MarR family transcriptional regulator [Dehalococcoidia bacterium]